jgi:hypothetical protein
MRSDGVTDTRMSDTELAFMLACARCTLTGGDLHGSVTALMRAYARTILELAERLGMPDAE